MVDLGNEPLTSDTVGLLEGLTSTRTIRRYRDEPIPESALRDILFAATRAPSGSNRQPFRFLVLTDGPKAREAKRLIGESATRLWGQKREHDGYDQGSGEDQNSPKARMARTMQGYVESFERVPVLILPCLIRYRDPSPTEGASIYPRAKTCCSQLGPLAMAVPSRDGNRVSMQNFTSSFGFPTTSSSPGPSPWAGPRGRMDQCAADR